VPTEYETLHFSIGGATGTGKSTIIKEAIYSSLKRGTDKRYLDPNGEYVETFYRENDMILSPYDKRSPGWSMFNEIRDEFDYDLYAVSIIQESKERSAEEWYRYGRLFIVRFQRSYSHKTKPFNGRSCIGVTLQNTTK
jgi:DNA helicase HerA-like ATPase